MRTVRGALAASAAAMIVLAGCSSESTPAEPGASTATQASTAGSAAQSSTGATALDKFLLQAGDLPAGFSEMNIPADQLGTATDSLLASTKNATVSPASCQPDLSGISADAVATNAASYFTSATTGELVGSIAVPDAGYLEKYRQYNLGDCATHEVTSSINGQRVTGTITSTTVDVDTPGVDGAVVIKQDATSDVPGAGNIKQTSYIALLPADGATVSISQRKLIGADAPDLAVFRTVVAAVAKRVAG